MQVYLLRHGIAEPPRPGLDDPGRALLPEGKKRLRAVLRAAKAAGVTLLEIRLAKGLGGKGFFTFTGEVFEVETQLNPGPWLDTHPEGEARCKTEGPVWEGVWGSAWLADGRLVSDGDAGLRMWDLEAGTSRQATIDALKAAARRRQELAAAVDVTRPGGRVLFSSYAEAFWDHRLAWFRLQAREGLLGEIDEAATGAVHDTDTRFQLGDGRARQDVPGLVGERHVKGDEIRLLEDLLDVITMLLHRPDADRRGLLRIL